MRLTDNLRRAELGHLVVAEGADLAAFFLSDGRATARPALPKLRTLKHLLEAYMHSLPTGAIERSTRQGMDIHIVHRRRILGDGLVVASLSSTDLQRYVDARALANGTRGRTLSAATIKKELVTLRGAWNCPRAYPSDQLIRNIRVGLWECGWLRPTQHFELRPSNFAVLLLGPEIGHCLVTKYRDSSTLLRSIPCSDRLRGLPEDPFVGEDCYLGVAKILRKSRPWMNRVEKLLVDDLSVYLAYKSQGKAMGGPTLRQTLMASAI